MFKHIKLYTVMLFSFLCLFISTSCSKIGYENKNDLIQDNKDDSDKIDQTESLNYDSEGGSLVPYDLSNSESFLFNDVKYERNSLLIKFKDNFSGRLTKSLENAGVVGLKKMNDKSSWYLVKIKDANIDESIAKIRELSFVQLADYNYIYENSAFDLERLEGNPKLKDQWYLSYLGIDKTWGNLEHNGGNAGGSSDVVVAVIDTGVDYTHNDLKNNMWININEIPDNNIDDDRNGYVDDIYGANMVSRNGDPMDDHGHGTHVAGIIAGSNNREGIVGVAYNSKIMAIKAGQATGVFTSSDIADAILYAYEMGADVINMSFGGSASSIAVQDALSIAYSRCVLVAAAGNDGKPNENTKYDYASPSYPAAFSYVLGVMSVGKSGVESNFTNWDVDAYNSVEYEVYAPGEAIVSTIPNGGYASWNGTSMAAPIVSGIAALLRSEFKDRDMYPTKYIMAQIAATSTKSVVCINPREHVNAMGFPHNKPAIVDPHAALTKLPKPDVNLYDHYIFDDKEISEKNNGNGVVEAGETIYVAPIVKNRWGMSKETILTIDSKSPAGIDNPYVTIVNDEINFEGVGTYSTKDYLIREEGTHITGATNTFIVKIDDDIPNDYLINLNIYISYKNALDSKDKEVYESEGLINLTARNGFVLPSQINEDMTLTKNNYYIIPNSTIIKKGVTVNVEPGTKIQFWSNDPEDPYAPTYIAYLKVEGTLNCNGTLEEPVQMFPSELMSQYRVEILISGNGIVNLNYTTVTNPEIEATNVDHSTFNQNYVSNYGYAYRYLSNGKIQVSDSTNQIRANSITNSIFYKLGTKYSNMYIYANNISNNIFYSSRLSLSSYANYTNNVFLGNFNGYGPMDLALSNNFSLNINGIEKDNASGITAIRLQGLYSIESKDRLMIEKLAKYLGGIVEEDRYNYCTIIRIPTDIYINKIELEKDSISISTNSNYKVSPILDPITADMSSLIYISEDKSIAKVSDSGVITGVSKGETRIFVYSSDYNVYAILNVKVVKPISVETISSKVENSTINLGDTEKIITEYNPENTTDLNLTYESSDTNVATVDNYGMITAKNVGVATITVKAENGYESTFNITVVLPVEKISFKDSTYVTSLEQEDDASDYLPSIYPDNATNKNIIWKSSNPEVAFVDENNNLVKLSEGSTLLVATIENTSMNAELRVSISSENNESAEVIKMDYSNGAYIALLSNGNLYTWGTNYGYPHLVDTNVMDFIYKSGGMILYIKNNKLYKNISNVSDSFYDNFRNYNLSRIYSYDNSFFAEDTEGNIWAYGANSNNKLGINGVSTITSPVQIDISDVKNIVVTGHCTVILTNNGDVYIANQNFSTFTLINKNIKEIYVDKYSRTFPFNIYMKSFSEEMSYVSCTTNNINSVITIPKNGPGVQYYFSTYLTLEDGKSISRLFVKNNNVYGTSDYHGLSGDTINNLTNVTKVYAFAECIFMQTSDGKFYGQGLNVDNQLGDMSYEYKYKESRIWFGIETNENINIKTTNLNENKLEEKNFDLTFDKAIKSASSYMYISLKDSKGTNLPVNKSFDLKTFSISPKDGYKEGETYTLTIPSKSFVSIFGKEYESEYTVTFTIPYTTDPIEFVSSNVSDGHYFESENVCMEFDYTFAIEGDKFNEIKVINSNDEIMDANISLIDNKLVVSGMFDYDSYNLVIPSGALKDNFEGINDEIELSFNVIEKIALINASHKNLDERKLVDESIVFEFNNAIEGDNFENIKLFYENNEEIRSNITLDNNILTINPVNDLLENSVYRVQVPIGALKDSAGNENKEINNTFTTYSPLEFITSSIETGEKNVNISPIIKLYYNYIEEGNNYSNIRVIDVNNNEVPLTITVEESSILVIKTNEILNDNSEYTLIVDNDSLKDELGKVNEEIRISFTTYEIDERFFYTAEYLKEKYDEWVKKGENSQLTNNAILNNLNDANVEHWFRITGSNSGDSNNPSVGLAGNYWGTVIKEMIELQILDFDDYQTLWDIVVGEYLTEAPEDTFPFVTSVSMYNKNGDKIYIASNETVTFVVEFNRDMDVSMPLHFAFGSSEPYNEYVIEGEYENARKWVGTYTLKTTIENGNQYINISNGRAADDYYLQLFEVPGRHMFVIDTTSAQSMIMQANATDEGIELSWYQDDFDTLAGYNVYRSEAKDGYYQRLNRTIISADIKSFFDDTVMPGKHYYYNFTVVRTDLTESTPSGKIDLYSKDTLAPGILHTPVYNAITDKNLVISAVITDNLRIHSANLYYRMKGETQYNVIAMTNNNSRYSAIIISDYVTLAGLEYYIEASDGISYVYKASADNPYEIVVKQGIDDSSLGDVNNDGIITNLDALMILQAINDKLNLTSDQFARADLDKNGILESKEVLKILKYVSGTITNIA